MAWRDLLEELLADRNKAAVSRACGWDDFRVSQIVGRGALPNAIDALILCDYLGMSVEAIFGPDAEEELGRPLFRRAATPDAAAAAARAEALAGHHAARSKGRRGSARARGKGRKTG
jgi:hypothetical protein